MQPAPLTSGGLALEEITCRGWGPHLQYSFTFAHTVQNRNFHPKGEGRSGRRPLLPKRKLNILVDLTLGKSYHSVVTFLHAQKIKCDTFSI